MSSKNEILMTVWTPRHRWRWLQAIIFDCPNGTDREVTPYNSMSNFPGRNARRKILIHLQFKKIFLNPHVVAPHSRNDRNRYNVPYRRATLQSALRTCISIFGRTQTSFQCNISCNSDTGIQNQKFEISTKYLSRKFLFSKSYKLQTAHAVWKSEAERPHIHTHTHTHMRVCVCERARVRVCVFLCMCFLIII
jgi:hypothetical protein